MLAAREAVADCSGFLSKGAVSLAARESKGKRRRSGRLPCVGGSTTALLSQLNLRGSAVAGALQHPKIGAPRTHGVPILVGHNPRDLVQMRQVVNGPVASN